MQRNVTIDARQWMVPFLRRCASIWFVVVVSMAFGCDRSGLDLAPVEGVVTYNGAPLADAGVLFSPRQGPFATGVTDEEGKFTLMTANHDGALVGDHDVAISKMETVVRYAPGNPYPIYETKPLIPRRYFEPSTSELTASVADDDNVFEFRLTSK